MKTETKLVSAAVIFAIVLPIFSIAVLGSLGVITENDVAYPERVSQILNYAKETLNVLCVFVCAVILALSFALKKSRKALAAVSFISIPTVYFTSALVDLGFYGSQAVSAVYILPMLVNSVFEAVRYIIIIFVAKNISKNAAKKNLNIGPVEFFSLESIESRCAVFATIAVFCTLIFSTATDTVSLLMEYGAPINSSELTYLLTPYITAVVYAAAGYLISVLLTKKLIKR